MKSGHNIITILLKQKLILSDPSTPKPFTLWKHYKGGTYYVKELLVFEETEQIHVCYSSIDYYLPCYWSRSLKSWNEVVEYEGKTMKRFTQQKTTIVFFFKFYFWRFIQYIKFN